MDKILDKKEENLKYNGEIKTNKRGEAILGTLEGVCAECFAPTRNGRQYSEKLWENVFKDPIVNEYFNCGGILGELDHPEDRLETDTSKIAVCMPEKPKKNNKGQLVAKFDILDTPNGRIVATLAKYGYKLGISSRGDGEVETDYDGKESVNPNTYQLKAFDIVLLPAVKSARLNMVESLQNKKSFNQALTEAFNKCDADGKKTMAETLKNLNIDYNPEMVDNKNSLLTENVDNKNNVAGDTGTDLDYLQEVLKDNKILSHKVMELQEKLSVCNAKEISNQEELERYKTFAIKLSESTRSNKALNSKIKTLEEQLVEKDKDIQTISSKLTSLSEKFKDNNKNNITLNESLDSKNNIIKDLKNQIRSLNESINIINKEKDSNTQILQENIETLKKNSLIKKKEFDRKLDSANNLTEKYRIIAKTVVEEYIKQKALMIGVTPAEIKNRLNENYSINDINRVCENLQTYSLNINKLPFDISRNKPVKMSIKESVETITPKNNFYDDTVDEDLLKLANIK